MRYYVESVFRTIDRATGPVNKMTGAVNRYVNATTRGLRVVNGMYDRTATAIIGASRAAAKWATYSFGAGAAAVTYFVRQFSKIEDAEAAFTPLMGGAERARAMVEALNKTAATTPFQFENLASVANRMLPSLGGDIDKTIAKVRMLGDTAGGSADKMDRIANAYAKALGSGKVDLEILKQIGDAGVPIFQQLADTIGVSVPKLYKLISAGKVTEKQLTATFERMTSEGGVFYRGMEIASRTTSGLWSTMMDNISQSAAAIGKVLAPTINELINEVTTVAARVKDWATANHDMLRARVVEYVEKIKAGIIALGKGLAWLWRHRETVAKVAATVATLVVVLKTLSVVMAIVNLVMMANPIGLIVVAIGALIAAVAAAVIWWDDLKAAFLGLPGPVQTALKLLASPILRLIELAQLVRDNWEPIKAFFADLWGGITAIFSWHMDMMERQLGWVLGALDKVRAGGAAVAGWFSDDEQAPAPSRQNARGRIVSTQEQNARTIEERRELSRSEVVITDQTGRARAPSGLGPGVTLRQSGAF